MPKGLVEVDLFFQCLDLCLVESVKRMNQLNLLDDKHLARLLVHGFVRFSSRSHANQLSLLPLQKTTLDFIADLRLLFLLFARWRSKKVVFLLRKLVPHFLHLQLQVEMDVSVRSCDSVNLLQVLRFKLLDIFVEQVVCLVRAGLLRQG